MLLVACAHEKIADQASQAVLSDISFAPLALRQRQLWLDSEREHKIGKVLSDKLRKRISETGAKDGGENVILIVDILSSDAVDEVRELLRKRGKSGGFTDKKFFVIFEIAGSALDKAGDLATFANGVPFWSVNPIPHILAAHKIPEDSAAKVEHARNTGRFLRVSDQEFARQVEALAEGGTLEQFLATPAATLPVRAAETDARSLLTEANPVEKAALFLAALFSDTSTELRIGEFEQLIRLLLKDEPDFAPPSTTRGLRGNPAPAAKPRSALDVWATEQEQICRKLGLQFREAADGALVIDFTEPDVRRVIRKELFPPYISQQLERLHNAGILLDPATSRRVVNALIEVTTRMAPQRPDVFDRDWLLGQFRSVKVHFARYSAHASALLGIANAAQLEDSGLLMELRKHSGEFYNQLLSRLVQMCRGFLNDERTSRITAGFLDGLIESTQPNCNEALEIVKRLRGHKAFDPGPRYRHFLTVGSTELKQQVYATLLGEMRDDDDDVEAAAAWRGLARVADWLPPVDAKDISESQKWALTFIYTAWEDFRGTGEGNDTPIPWLAEHPELPPAADRRDRIAEWFAHPALASAITDVFRQITSAHQIGRDWLLLYELYLSTLGEGYTLGDAHLAEALSGFYRLSGDARFFEITDILSRKMPRAMLDKLRFLIRQDGDVSGDDLRDSSAAQYTFLKTQMKRAYDMSRALRQPTTATTQTTG